jgi:hypothetical protein
LHGVDGHFVFAPPPTTGTVSSCFSASRISIGMSVAPGGDRPLSLPSKVTLTREELEAARFSNISPEEYAKNKLRMQRAKLTGEIQ